MLVLRKMTESRPELLTFVTNEGGVKDTRELEKQIQDVVSGRNYLNEKCNGLSKRRRTCTTNLLDFCGSEQHLRD